MKVLSNERWMKHPWSLTGLVCNIDIKFLMTISNQSSTNYTDLLNGDVVHQDEVWKDIKSCGLQEPLLIIIGYKDKTIRLESGNHRIKTALLDGVTHLPVAVQVTQESVFNRSNGDHYFDAKGLLDWNQLVKCAYPYQVDPILVLPKRLFTS